MSLGIGNTNGEEWYRLRSNSHQRMLRPKELEGYMPGVNQVAVDFVERLNKVKYLHNQEVTDLRSEVGLWNLETAGLVVFDKRLGCLYEGSDGEHFGRKMVDANAIVFKLAGILKLSFPIYKIITTPKWRKMVEAEDFLYAEAINLVDEAVLRLREEVEKGTPMSTERFYFLKYLLSRPDLSLKDVTVICLSVFLDGLSTTTPSTLFCLYSLAVDERVQELLYQEVTDVAGSDFRNPITANQIGKMPYLKAFVKETFRLWPNGTEVSRYTDKQMVLSGYSIPPGTHVDLNPTVNFKDPSSFYKPDEFLPERWLRKEEIKPEVCAAMKKSEDGETVNKDATDVTNSASDIHPFLMTPFSHGTRMCAGRRLAEQHIYTVLAKTTQKFKLKYPVGEQMDQIYNTLLFPDRPVRVKFVERCTIGGET